MRIQNPRSTQDTQNRQVSDLDRHAHKQSTFLRIYHRWIITTCIVVALLSLLAIIVPPLLPTHQAGKIRPHYQQTQIPVQPATTQPLAKNTENLVGLDQHILCVSDDAGNNIYGLQRDNGKIVWQYHETHATLETLYGNERLYLSEQDSSNANIRMLSLDGGKTLWQHAFSGLNIASLVVEDAALYVTGQNNTLYVLQNTDGKLLWHYSFPPNTSYTQADSVTLAYTEDGRSLWALQASNGKLLWHIAEHTSSWPLTASAGITFLQTQDGYLKALNSQNGQQMWQSTIATVADNPVKIVDTTAYINTGDGLVKAVNISDGRTLWQYKPAQPIMGEVTLTQHILYATGLDNVIYALDNRTGTLLWRQRIHDLTSELVIAGASIYVHSSEGSEYALNATTGARRWSRNLARSNIYRTFVLNDRHALYIMGANETLTALDSNTGSFLWKQPILNFPLFSDKNIYVNSVNGSIDAIDSSAGTLQWYVSVSR